MSAKIEIQYGQDLTPHMGNHIGSWRTWDLEFLRNRKAMEKTRRGLSDLAYDFNMLVLFEKERKPADRAIGKIEIDPQAINVVYTNNVTTDYNWIPMTPWILALRIGHAMINDEEVFVNDDYREIDGPEAYLFLELEKLYTDAILGPMIPGAKTGLFDKRLYVETYVKAYKSFSAMCGVHTVHVGWLATCLFTMKSARERMLSSDLDIFAEAFAQFFITGRFRMKRWHESGIGQMKHTKDLPKHPSSQTDWGEYLNHPVKMHITPEEFDDRVGVIEATANAKMKELADRLVGKAVVF